MPSFLRHDSRHRHSGIHDHLRSGPVNNSYKPVTVNTPSRTSTSRNFLLRFYKHKLQEQSSLTLVKLKNKNLSRACFDKFRDLRSYVRVNESKLFRKLRQKIKTNHPETVRVYFAFERPYAYRQQARAKHRTHNG